MNRTQSDKGISRRDYSEEQVLKLIEKLQELRIAHLSVKVNLSVLSSQLSVSRARTFANEGLGRRLAVIERSVLNIYEIYPPDRKKFLSPDECNDIAIQLHAFAINLYGIFDNIAWVCVLEAKQSLSPLEVGLFNKKLQPHLPKNLKEYISKPEIQTWFNSYGKVYRDSTTHRIPPYLPSRAYSVEEGERFKELDSKSMKVLLGWKAEHSAHDTHERLTAHEQIEIEKEALGWNSLLIALSLTGEENSEPVFLHPQLLSDWGLAHELILIFMKAIRSQYGFEEPTIPI